MTEGGRTCNGCGRKRAAERKELPRDWGRLCHADIDLDKTDFTRNEFRRNRPDRLSKFESFTLGIVVPQTQAWLGPNINLRVKEGKRVPVALQKLGGLRLQDGTCEGELPAAEYVNGVRSFGIDDREHGFAEFAVFPRVLDHRLKGIESCEFLVFIDRHAVSTSEGFETGSWYFHPATLDQEKSLLGDPFPSNSLGDVMEASSLPSSHVTEKGAYTLGLHTIQHSLVWDAVKQLSIDGGTDGEALPPGNFVTELSGLPRPAYSPTFQIGVYALR
jgi:hypothetical protein